MQTILGKILKQGIHISIPEDISLEIDLRELLDFDVHGDLAEQFKKDLLYFSAFGILDREFQSMIRDQKVKLDQLEADTHERLRAEILEATGKAPAISGMDVLVNRDPQVRELQDSILVLQSRLGRIQGIVDALGKKAIALNVLTARDKAELLSGLRQ
jgi:hypothetical protein